MIALLPVLLTTGWVALLVAAPVLPGLAAAVVYGVGSFICHQLPERSFHFAGFQLPVCARCLGIYVGVSVGVTYVWMQAAGRRMVPALQPRTARGLGALAATPTLLTVALEATGVWSPSNLTRAIAGLPLGALVGLVVMNALATLHYDECVPPRPTAPKPPQRSI